MSEVRVLVGAVCGKVVERHTDGVAYDLKNLFTFDQTQINSRMANRYEELEKLVSEVIVDLRKFYDDGNKAAGTRARKGLLALKNWAHEVRKEIAAARNAAESQAPSKPAGASKTAPKAPKPAAKPKKK